MAHTTQILYRVNFPGGGYSSSGTAKNNKSLVVARVTCTDVTSGLETFNPSELGLEAIDVLFPLLAGTASGGQAYPAKSATTSAHIDYDVENNRFVICDIAAAGDRTAITNGEDPIIQVFAVGTGTIHADLT